MFFRITVALILLPFLQADQLEDPGKVVESRKDLIINASSINGSVIINGDTSNSNITITGSEIQGDITFDNGCAVAGDTVYECDGSQRQLNFNEKKKMARRRAQIIRQQKQLHRRDVVEYEAVNRKRKSKRKGKNHGYNNKKFKDSGAFSPCKSCHQQKANWRHN